MAPTKKFVIRFDACPVCDRLSSHHEECPEAGERTDIPSVGEVVTEVLDRGKVRSNDRPRRPKAQA